MTRLPSDSFLPSGALDHDPHMSLGSDSSSVISPLALPHGATYYFDPHNSQAFSTAAGGPGPARTLRSPRSAAALRPSPPGQPSQLLSPLLTPTSTNIHHQLQLQQQQQHQQQLRQQQRSASLSPTRRAVSVGGAAMARTRSAVASPSRMSSSSHMLPLDGALRSINGAAYVPGSMASTGAAAGPFPTPGQPRSSSADAATPSQAALVQHLKLQNKIIREAWENERKYLEANRSRAEEVYREERAIMEAERAEWDSERAALVDRIRMLEDADRRPRFSRPGTIDEEGPASSTQSLRGLDSWDASPERTRAARDSSSSFQPFKSVSPPSSSSDPRPPPSRVMLPEAAPFTSQPQQARPDFLITEPMDSPEGHANVDVHEIHPDLEGIPIKTRAIKKTTFQHGSPPDSKTSSGKPSPPSHPARPGLKAMTSTEQTLKALAAGEDQRLTMHAGHTPSHSLSLFPTTRSTEAATTASSSGESTPKLDVAAADPPVREQPAIRRPMPAADIPEPVLEPRDDVELKGPLMVRNIPAKDAIFFRRLSEKLERVVRTDDAPTVVKKPSPVLQAVAHREADEVVAGQEDGKDAEETEASAAHAHAEPETKGETASADVQVTEEDTRTNTDAMKGPTTEPVTDGKTAADPEASEKEDDEVGDAADRASSPKDSLNGDDETDIPLKLKTSNNFGAPFGAVRQFAF